MRRLIASGEEIRVRFAVEQAWLQTLIRWGVVGQLTPAARILEPPMRAPCSGWNRRRRWAVAPSPHP